MRFIPFGLSLLALVTGCSLFPEGEPSPTPEPSPSWSFTPPPHGSYEGRVAVSATTPEDGPVYRSVGGDPTVDGELQSAPLWLGTRGEWSVNWSTPVGDGWDTVRSTTYRVRPERPQAAAGADHALVIESTVLWARGHGVNGQLGQAGKPSMQNEWKAVSPTEAVLAVWAAGDNTLFLDESGELWACGYGPWLDGEIDYVVGTATPLRVPLPEGTRVVTAAVSALGGVWAVDQNGDLWVWGSNAHGAFGAGAEHGEVRTPAKVLSDIAMVAVGPYHALALGEDGTVRAAGLHDGTEAGSSDDYNRLGTGTDTADHDTWVSVKTWDKALAVGAAVDHSWLLTEDGDVWVWGSNAFGQLPGQAAETQRLDLPTHAASDVALVYAGTRHTLVAPEEGSLETWGEAPSGAPSLRAQDGLRSLHGGTSFLLALTGGFHDAAAHPWDAVRLWGLFNS